MQKVTKPKQYTMPIPESPHECLLSYCDRCLLRDCYCWGSERKPNGKRVEKNIQRIIEDNKPFVHKVVEWKTETR